MIKHFIVAILFLSHCFQPVVYAGQFDEARIKMLSAQAEREAKETILNGLFGHYDIVTLKVLKIEGVALGRDYPVAKAILSFSTKRNTSRHPSLNRAMFEPGNCTSTKVPEWFYLHCGVPTGYVFNGKLELLLVRTEGTEWRALSPNWRAIISSPLQGYLIEKEGPIVFSEEGGR